MSIKILIVDDDIELNEELSEILQDNGYSVESSVSAIEGEALINKNTYDLYLLDYKMTGLTGVDLLRRIKKKHPESRVVIISGRPFIENILKEENVYNLTTRVIKKPFEIDGLLQTIRDLVSD